MTKKEVVKYFLYNEVVYIWHLFLKKFSMYFDLEELYEIEENKQNKLIIYLYLIVTIQKLIVLLYI